MRSATFFFLSGVVLIVSTQQHVLAQRTAILKEINDIPLPDGYERVQLQHNSFGYFLRHQNLKTDRTVYLYNGSPKSNQAAQYAVLATPVGNKDLQQCADAVMRLRAEHLKQQNKPVCFADNAGKKYCWDQHRHRGWQPYLETVFAMCGTLSLEKELKRKEWAQLSAGDVLIKGGSPGHAVIVMDVAKHKTNGQLIFLLTGWSFRGGETTWVSAVMVGAAVVVLVGVLNPASTRALATHQ